VPDFRLQPIVDLCTGGTVGLELLAGQYRCPEWTDAQWREWYGRTADVLERYAPAHLLVFVNVTGQQMLDPDIRAGLLRCARVRCTVLEWTEEPYRCNLPGVVDAIEAMSPYLAALAIDDVGDGLDGIGRTMDLRPNFVKLSMKLVWHARTRPEFLRHVGDLFAGMGAEVIAEGIETPEDLELVRDSGVRYGQGYLLGKGAVDEAGKEVVVQRVSESVVRFTQTGPSPALFCGSELCLGRAAARCKPFGGRPAMYPTESLPEQEKKVLVR
jgi:EAL domain-containing protein (putative c-di-GMP-specific phosphodiesterase class I)